MGVIKKTFENFYHPLPNPPPERGRETRYKVGLSVFYEAQHKEVSRYQKKSLSLVGLREKMLSTNLH
jgi:hypothetical protein